MRIKRYIGGDIESNGYVISADNSAECLVIDPGYNAYKFADYIKSNGMLLKGILLTHHHHDHVDASDELRSEFKCPVYIHKDDVSSCRAKTDVILHDGDRISIEGLDIDVLNTPGHTWGCVCYYLPDEKAIFTGDTAFMERPGRTDLSDGSREVMKKTITDILAGLDPDITAYPGHGESCSMGHIHKTGQEWITNENVEY